MTDWRDKIKQARLPEAVVPIVLRGDLAAEHEQVSHELEEAKARGATSLAGSGTAPLRERLRDIEAEMKDSVVDFRLRALPRGKRPGDARPSWPQLAAEHPAREKPDGTIVVIDYQAGGINQLTHPEALVRVSVVEPELTAGDWDDVLAAMTQRQFDELVTTAWRLNQARVDIPFSSDASATPRTSDGV